MAPITPALSISALLAGYPTTAVAPNFILTVHNSHVWLTHADGRRRRAQYTGLQGSRPKKKKKVTLEFVLHPGNTVSTVFSQPHTEKLGGGQPA